jgi:hypothetical protein
MKLMTLSRLVRALISATLAGLCSCSATRMAEPEGIPRFANVEPGRLWRGGQPTEAGLDQLQKLGVRRIVKLNSSRLEFETREAKKRGMEVTALPISFLRQSFGNPDPARLRAAVEACNSGEKTYIHCTHGRDRTGLLVGLYRVHCQHKECKEAYHEMCDCGFRKSLLGLQWAWDTESVRDSKSRGSKALPLAKPVKGARKVSGVVP